MTYADPLSVSCPLCGQQVGSRCTELPRLVTGVGVISQYRDQSHAARRTVAERANHEEKTMTTEPGQPDVGRPLHTDQERTVAEVAFSGIDAVKLGTAMGITIKTADSPAVHDEILNTAKTIINGDRRKDYGSARESFETIAKLWAPILGVELAAHEVALCMIQLKVARAMAGAEKRDSWVDMCGYAALGGELAHEDHVRVTTPVTTNDEENS